MERYIETSVETPGRQAANPDRPGYPHNIFSVLGAGLTSLLAALILIFFIARIFPTQHAFESLAAYLPLHTAMETFAIVVCMLVFALGWNADSRQDAGNIMLLSCAFLAVGLLDFGHMLSFPGMPGFFTASTTEKTINFSLAAHGLAALALLAAAAWPWWTFASPPARYWLLAATLGITALVYFTVLFHQDKLPATFIVDRGLTSFKIEIEYALIAIYCLAATVFLFRLRIQPAGYLRQLFAACCVAVLSELFFTFYRDITDNYYLLGHAFKVIAYFLIYKALFVRGIEEPRSQLHQFQLALQENKARFQSLAQLSSDWYWEQDAEFRFTFMSGGLSMIGKHRWELPITGASAADWEQHKLILEQHLPFHDFTYQITDKRQGKRWFSISGVPVFDNQGHFKGYRGTGRDITERKQAENARHESEERLSGIVGTAMHAIIMVDEDMNIVLFNPAAERIFGYLSGEITGTKLDRLIPERYRDNHKKHMKMFGATRATVRAMNGRLAVRGLRANGEEFPAEASISHLALNGKKLYTVNLADVTKRVETEKSLRLSAEVFETSSEGIIVSDASHRIVSVNPAFTTITGYTPDEVIGKSPDMLSSGMQDGEFYRKMWASINETGRWQGEIWDRRKNGEIYCERLSISTVKNLQEEIVYHTVIFYDITEWKRTEKALRASETEMRLVTDNIPAMISCFDENLRCRFANKRYLEVFGFSAERLLGRHLQEIVGKTVYQKIKDHFDKVLKGHPVTYLRTRQLTNGESRDMETRLVPHTSEQGKILGCYALTTDITERKQAEAARAGLAAIVESSHDAIISRGLDGRILSWNAGAAHMLGYSAAEVVGQPMAIIVPPDRQHAIASNTERLRRGEMIPAFETRRRHKDGRIIEVWSAISPIRNETGEVIGAASIIRDVSQLKHAERELRSKAALTELLEALARAANEATTPEAALQACLERICAYGDWTLGHVALYAPGQSGGIAQTSFWHGLEQTQFNEFIHYSDRFSHNVPKGRFAGVALRERRPVWVEDILKAGGSGRLDVASKFGIRSGFVFPVVVDDETAAFLEFFAEDVRERDTLLLEAIGSVASQLARLIERGRAEVARGQLAAIVENSNDAIISRTLDGIITSWNTGAERMFGYSAKEAIGQSITFILAPGRRPNLERNTVRMLRDEIVAPHESQRITKNGRVIDILVSISPIRDNTGEIIGAAVILHDISALKQAESAAKQSEERFRAAFEQAGVGMALREFDQLKPHWLRVNQKLCDILGYTRDELLQLTFLDVTLPEDRGVTIDYNAQLLRGAISNYSCEKRFVRKDGQIIWANIDLSAVSGPDGRQNYIISVIEDITAQKRAEERILSLNAELEQRVMERTRQLEATNKELEAFSYSVSHDLRAPLRGIDGFSQMLLKKYADHLDETASDYLQRIRRASMHMGELIDDMLQLSRVSGSEVKTEAVDLSQQARSILEALRETEPQRAVEIEVQDGVVITGDVRLLKIALENLLANAWKFTGKKKHAKIRVGSRKQDGEQVVFVKDNGAGFNMKYAHKLFGAFQRLHGMTEFAGTGIGLATVQRIMTLHGGRVWANAAIDRGATFYFIIPRSAPNKMTTP